MPSALDSFYREPYERDQELAGGRLLKLVLKGCSLRTFRHKFT